MPRAQRGIFLFQGITHRLVLRVLLFAHAIVTFAAGVVLVVVPGAIPSTIGVHIAPGAFVVCYLLAGAEFSLAYLSFLAARSTSPEGIRIAVQTIVALHATTALLEVYAISQGIAPMLWANVIVRVAVIAVFYYFGLRPRA